MARSGPRTRALRIEALVAALPKAELHIHLEGAIQPELALQLARRRGVKLPGMEGGADGLRAEYRFTSFRAFIDMYQAVSSCLQRVEDFAEVVQAVARDLAAQRVVYAEVTFTPCTHLRRGVAEDVLLAGLVEGRARARELDVDVRWVLDIVRLFPDHAEPTLQFARNLRARDPTAVVGLGLAGPEAEEHSIEAFAEVFAAARAEGIRSLPHAGEHSGPESIWKAVEVLGADRIGHGVRCLEDPRLVEHLRERRIPLEVCPSSNVVLGVVNALAGHPIDELLAAGLHVTLASDDPALFQTSCNSEYLRCARTFGWDEETIRRLAADSLLCSFMPALEARRWLGRQRATRVTHRH